jgi:triosephosphate isomerase
MNLGIAESLRLTYQLVELSTHLSKSEIWVACTSPALFVCGEAAKDSKVKIGAQNAFSEEKGAFTGEISPLTLKEAHASFSLIGHSERRILFGKTNEQCAMRALGLLKAGIKVIFCIGETLQERESGEGQTMAVLESQLTPLLMGLEQATDLDTKVLSEQLLLAYEPVWAIGSGLAATSAQIAEVHSAIPQVWSKSSKLACPKILYGGSMNKANCKEILAVPGVAGGLIGGASNTYESFSGLIAASEES